MTEGKLSANVAEVLAKCPLRGVDFADLRMVSRSGDNITFRDGQLHTACRLVDRGFFLRVCSNGQWACGSTNVVEKLPGLAAELREHAESLTAGNQKSGQKSVRGIPSENSNRPAGDELLRFQDGGGTRFPMKTKVEDLKALDSVFSGDTSIVNYSSSYMDILETRAYVDLFGTAYAYDKSASGLASSFTLSREGKTFSTFFMSGMSSSEELRGLRDELNENLQEARTFLKASDIVSGDYPVVLSPMAAGVFCHESFGHKSEADLMLGDPRMQEEWKIGMEIGSPILSIVDDPLFSDSLGYTPFDDEGTPGCRTHLIEKGILAGRLHSLETAWDLDEAPTGNARGVAYGFEPIVRMTTTYIIPGESSFEDLIRGIKLGVYVKTVKSGSGMSTFTMAPDRCFMIRDGKLAEPVMVSVVSGSVFETLGLIDGISDTLEIFKAPFAGCGKMEQYPLEVGMGGPSIRVSKMRVS